MDATTFFRSNKSKSIFWDTSCYRRLGRAANEDTEWLRSLMQKLKTAEKENDIMVKVPYLVLTEMLTHLTDSIHSEKYVESKLGLQAALIHTDFEPQRLLPFADLEFIKANKGIVPAEIENRQESLYQFILEIYKNGFHDDFINQRKDEIKKAADFLNSLKSSWIDSFVDNFIKLHDPDYAGNWSVYVSEPTKKTKLLKELRKAKENGAVYNEFGTGLYQYVSNSYPFINIPIITEDNIFNLIERFKPLFDLQYRILEFMSESGYNLSKRTNDIADFLIVANLDPKNLIFVSHEYAKLIPNLHQLGYQNIAMTQDQYFSILSIECD